MNELNDILKINLASISIFDITEEHLISLKAHNHYVQSNFYFYLYEKSLHILDNEELAYVYYLMSYYIFIIYTPLNYESIAYTLSKKALSLHRELKYMEWILIFSTLPLNFLSTFETLSLAEEVLEKNPSSITAKTILELY